MIDSMIASVTAEADAANPTDTELQTYLAENTGTLQFHGETVNRRVAKRHGVRCAGFRRDD